MTFDEAQEAFRETPCDTTAGQYLDTAMTYEVDDMIGDDTFLDALAEIRDFLMRTPGWRRK